MSKEAVVELFQTLDKDPELRERLTSIQDPAEVARIAESELSLSVTAEELTAAVASIQNPAAASEGELTEDDLEAVAGGSIWDGKWTDNVKIKLPIW